ncbi:hypothetical protein NDU88_005019 [Pleurodeles waltl]|uniref:Uncharacterized protein n=1 Tax=Pleurodeles waltl TaxID=8319 RepID=A0AAV7T9E6_PLEWA|nr:hypothetical protein NDU88_005019 [Pleurodeles waltl]
MVDKVDCHANTTWIRQVMELLERPRVCAADGPPMTKVLAHCEIAMDLNSQEIRTSLVGPLSRTEFDPGASVLVGILAHSVYVGPTFTLLNRTSSFS